MPFSAGEGTPPGDESPHVELSDAPAQLRCAAKETAEAWADEAALSSRFTMPWGEEYTGATLVDMYLAELAAHAWDLARATGQPDLARATGQLDRLDPSLALPALDGARAMIKPQYRNMVELGAPFGGGGAAASRRQRLGTPRRLHGTRPPSIARPVRVAGGGPARSPSRRQAPKNLGLSRGHCDACTVRVDDGERSATGGRACRRRRRRRRRIWLHAGLPRNPLRRRNLWVWAGWVR